MMNIEVRTATKADRGDLVRLYRLLETEMVALRPVWALADGLAEPIDVAFAEALEDPGTTLLVAEMEGTTVGFLLARRAPLLPQAEGEHIGAIDLIFVEPEARGVGVGERLRDTIIDRLSSEGIRRFDARVLPGHRQAKNFFEAGGFKARSIILHRD